MIPESCLAHLDVLNVGEGDLKLTFDQTDPQEVVRTKRIVEDMLRRGYALFAEIKGKLRPVKAFDEKTASYVIADGPLYAGDTQEPSDPQINPPAKRGRPAKIKASDTKVTAVPRSAGG